MPVLHVVVGHRRHRGRVGDALDEQQRGAHHADADGLREIGEHGQRERHDPDRSRRSSSGAAVRESPPSRPCCRPRPSESPPARRAGRSAPAARQRQNHQRASAHARCRRRASARPTGCWWPCGRWRPSPASRRRAATTMLATPWATSSTLESCRSPLMRSATIADISDSMAPEHGDGHGRHEQRAEQSRRNVGT